MLHAAKRYVIWECSVDCESKTTSVSADVQGGNPPVLKSVFLGNKLSALTTNQASKSSTGNCVELVQGHLMQYIAV